MMIITASITRRNLVYHAYRERVSGRPGVFLTILFTNATHLHVDTKEICDT